MLKSTEALVIIFKIVMLLLLYWGKKHLKTLEMAKLV